MHCVVAQRATSSARRFRIRVSSYHDCRCNRLDINGLTATIERRYDYGDDLFCQVDLPESEAPEPHYFVYDGLGSTRSLTDNQGTIEPGQQYNYQPFGEGIDHPTQLATNYLFTGEQFDQEANFYHLRARQYDPSLGRFTSFDSVEDYANRLHKYVYCRNEPTNAIDRSGEALSALATTVIVCGVIGAIVGCIVGGVLARHYGFGVRMWQFWVMILLGGLVGAGVGAGLGYLLAKAGLLLLFASRQTIIGVQILLYKLMLHWPHHGKWIHVALETLRDGKWIKIFEWDLRFW